MKVPLVSRAISTVRAGSAALRMLVAAVALPRRLSKGEEESSAEHDLRKLPPRRLPALWALGEPTGEELLLGGDLGEGEGESEYEGEGKDEG